MMEKNEKIELKDAVALEQQFYQWAKENEYEEITFMVVLQFFEELGSEVEQDESKQQAINRMFNI